LTPGYRVRAGSEKARWLPQPAFTWRLYPPGCTFWEDDREATEPTRSMWIAFTGGERIGLNAFISRTSGFGTFEDTGGTLVAHVEKMVEMAVTRGEAGYWTLQMELVRMIVLLESAKRIQDGIFRLTSGSLPGTPPDPRVAKATQYIKARVLEPITLGAIAKHAGTSVPTLARCFKEATGESPMQTWNRLRIERARDWLLDGKSIKEIAETLGYYDAFHLSKTFKQFQGCSPRAWLKSARSTPTSTAMHLRT
jgi:AraC-like DNA-binding protein